MRPSPTVSSTGSQGTVIALANPADEVVQRHMTPEDMAGMKNVS